jgi:hypothetical protein
MPAVLGRRDNAFGLLFGNVRGRDEDVLGRDLEGAERLQFVLDALSLGDLAPGFAWRGEDGVRALRTSDEKTRYALPAWSDTVEVLAQKLVGSELQDAQWVLETLGATTWKVTIRATAASAVTALHNELSTTLGRTIDAFGAQTPEQGRLQALPPVRSEVARRLSDSVRRGRIRLARQTLGNKGYTELHRAIVAGTAISRTSSSGPFSGDTKPSDAILMTMPHAWPVVLAHYHSHRDELRAQPTAQARARLRAVLLAECYHAAELPLPVGLVRAPERPL